MKYVKPMRLFHELLKKNEIKKGKLLGLDVGDKYVGLAVSDPLNKIAFPVSVLLRKKTNIELMATNFQSLISELSLEVSLLATLLTGKEAVRVKLFVDDLCKTGKLEGLKFIYWDERFTSKNVELLVKPLGLHPVQAKSIVDKFAAVGILQSAVKGKDGTSS